MDAVMLRALGDAAVMSVPILSHVPDKPAPNGQSQKGVELQCGGLPLPGGMCFPVAAIPGVSQDVLGAQGPALGACRGPGPVADLPQRQLAVK